MMNFQPTHRFGICADNNSDVQVTLFNDRVEADDYVAGLKQTEGVDWIDVIDFVKGRIVLSWGTWPIHRRSPSPFKRIWIGTCHCTEEGVCICDGI